VIVTHLAFQIMVGCGMIMFGVAAWYWAAWWRRRGEAFEREPGPALLLALVGCAPLGFLALEAGWVVTEVGRQPWVVYGVMRTRDGVTPLESVGGSLALFAALYGTLLLILVSFLRRLARHEPRGQHEH
jgi:cytochrome d ubiquinol oxidase subunit I